MKHLITLIASYLLLPLVLVYGAYGLYILAQLGNALEEAQKADTAYQYSQVVRALYRAAVACYRGELGEEHLKEVEGRIYLAEQSTNWDRLSPEARQTLSGLRERLPRLRDCDQLAAAAEEVFPVQVEATNLANRLRADLKAKLATFRRSLVFGLALLVILVAVVLVVQERFRRSQQALIGLLRSENRFKSRLLGLVAHELKTPLAAAAGFAELLGRASDDGERRRYLDGLLRASRRMRAVLHAFLDLHRLDATGSLPVRKAPVALAELAAEALEVAGVTFPQVRFRLEAPGEELTVEGDPDRLYHAVLNLLENAAKYGSGEVILRVREDSGRARIEVESAGELDPDRAEGLFRPFSRLPEHLGQEGWGLGLSLVAEVARAHGGEAGFEAEGGRLVFFLTLPGARPGGSPPSPKAQAG